MAKASRRSFVRAIAAVTAAAAGGTAAPAQDAGRVRGFDHVALPMQNTDAMIAFYRRLGFQITEGNAAVSVYVGDQMINFHRPALWQNGTFTLRAPAAKPPCLPGRAHHWDCPPGPAPLGTCRICGSTYEFPAWVDPGWDDGPPPGALA